MTHPLAQGFIRAAEDDIAAAKSLLPDLPQRAIFHVQQAAEKITRAACVQAGLPDVRSHDIGRQATRLSANHPDRALLFDLGYLSHAATGWRYPNSDGELPPSPKVEDVRRAVSDVELALAQVQERLSATD